MQARLDRADQHVQRFGEIWDEYLSTRPHRLKHTAEADGTLVVRLRRIKPLPVELSVVFGELLYELRAALDNCLYAVAVLVSGENPPPSAARLEWPIRGTPAEWKHQASRYRDLPPVIQEALEKIQPYQAELPGWNSLAILHELARVDRHRSMHGLGLYLSDLRMKADPRYIEVLDQGHPGIIGDGDQIVRLRLGDGVSLSSDNFNLKLKFDVDVTDVTESIGPSGRPGRPWGSLDKRLRALVLATRQYTAELPGIAADHVFAQEP
ncbi:hypothetical protein [Rathayibacter rathayi]|uniref:hypothetical protein n=1 Tax=Rathayibacter rathayi TaxID=33887 RepID=UPI0011AFE1E5|nr:hypothetical protein [Rathayibacter rathayi]